MSSSSTETASQPETVASPAPVTTDVPPAPPSSLLTHLMTAAKFAFAVGIVTWLVRNGDLDFGYLLTQSQRNYPAHLLGLLVLLASLVAQALRWYYLARAHDIHLPVGYSLRLAWIGQFFSIVLLGASGEAARAYYVVKDGYGRNAKIGAASSVLLDRVFGLYSLLVMGVPAFLYLLVTDPDEAAAVWSVGSLITLSAVGSTIGFALLWYSAGRTDWWSKVPDRIGQPILTALQACRRNQRDMVIAMALSFLGSFLIILPFPIAAHILDIDMSWTQAFLVVPWLMVAIALPISPGGFGVAEGIAGLLFAESGANVMLIVRLWFMLLHVPGGLFYVLR